MFLDKHNDIVQCWGQDGVVVLWTSNAYDWRTDNHRVSVLAGVPGICVEILKDVENLGFEEARKMFHQDVERIPSEYADRALTLRLSYQEDEVGQ